ncbi:hypothetical protein MNBD_NITROSPINAE05-1225 [hydrothermal vent metagenome]|uniref:WG repeat-containing protein n=1 Tax=hydrothermal vent metagenome TaxID=652676 RepID=A0A3B1CRL9_9ZZZZ
MKPSKTRHLVLVVLFSIALSFQVFAQTTEDSVQSVDLAAYPKASFHEGLAAVRIGDKYGYIDKDGRVVIKPRFDYAQIFSEGLARIVMKKRSGYIDKTGKTLIQPRFHKGFKFSDGLARVCAPPKNPTSLFRIARFLGWKDHYAYPCGYIDRTGKRVIDYQFLPASGFENGYAKVTTLDGTQGYIDHSGKFFPTRPEQ